MTIDRLINLFLSGCSIMLFITTNALGCEITIQPREDSDPVVWWANPSGLIFRDFNLDKLANAHVMLVVRGPCQGVVIKGGGNFGRPAGATSSTR